MRRFSVLLAAIIRAAASYQHFAVGHDISGDMQRCLWSVGANANISVSTENHSVRRTDRVAY